VKQHVCASMMQLTRRGMYTKAREGYSIEGMKAKLGVPQLLT